MPNIFDTSTETLYNFANKNGRGLYIPPYQRDYSWGRADYERVIDDTIQGLNAYLKRPDESITFMGTIITLNDTKKLTVSPIIRNQVYSQVLSIIDGQQRLTTLLIICLALLVEIEVQWGELEYSDAGDINDSKEWIERIVNNRRGKLNAILAERQNNGQDEFRYFPRMIRAYDDTWSYEADKAEYSSPISWIVFEYVCFREKNVSRANWAKFSNVLKNKAEGSAGKVEKYKNFLKMLKNIRDRFKNLSEDDEFPKIEEIAANKKYQDSLFGEEFPEQMLKSLFSFYNPAAASDESIGITNKKWWMTASKLIALLAFAEFALEKITLVVVTASTEEFAFDVFEALNTTGQPLTALETFVPKVVQSVEVSKYDSSQEKKYLDKAKAYIDSVRPEARQKRSADLLVAFALAEKGEKVSKHLADQRRFMRDAFESYSENKNLQKDFIRHLAELAGFLENTWVGDCRPKLDPQTEILDEKAVVFLRFLVDFGHTITVPLLAQYAAAVNSAGEQTEKKRATSNFLSVVMAITAFTVLWRTSRLTTDGIDQIYRDLMSKGSKLHGVPPLARAKRSMESDLPPPEKIMAALAHKLTEGGIKSKNDWVNKIVVLPLYGINTQLARFVLMLAFHQKVFNKGKLEEAKQNASNTLTYENWTNDLYASVEHIAPNTNTFGWSPDLYTDDENDRLGNLTLIPRNTNASLGNRPWQQKKEIFSVLSALTLDEAKTKIESLRKKGISITDTGATLYCGQYLPHLMAISQFEGIWNLEAVHQRGKDLAGFIWDQLAPCLNLEKTKE